MAPKQWINKKNAETYALVHRSQEDPLFLDADASERVFVKVEPKNVSKTASKKGLSVADLAAQEEEFKAQGRRENEGEAAGYGIQYDDSKYDYMQHLKPIGVHSDAIFMEKKTKGSGKKVQGPDLILKADYAMANSVALPAEALPSNDMVKITYQDMQNIPDAISGFQPDMEPELREVLEALEDEAYVAEELDDEEDIFSQIISSGRKEVVASEEFDWDNFDPEEYGSDFSDDTVTGADGLGLSRDAFSTNYIDHHRINEEFDDADIQFKGLGEEVSYGEEPFTGEDYAGAPEDVDWEKEFQQFKIDQMASKKNAGYDSESEAGDGLGALTTITRLGRKGKGKKKNGTELTGVSMSSSAMFRNEGLTLLDDKFDRLEEVYMNDDIEEEDVPEFDMSKERSDFESIMDDFLDNFDVVGKKMWKKTSKGATTGIDQLNDIRAAMR